MTTNENKRLTAKQLTVWTLIVLQTLPLSTWAATALVADPAATVKPVLNISSNGVPIVQIVPPNAGGVSHNKFTQYNVGAEGQILNNSGLGSTSALAGSVGGNPLLGNSNARLILNEVTSANPSALNGLIEITGKRADLVIANPNGISLDGAGFINASRATLTTGKPQFGIEGNVYGYSIQQGQISVLGKGLDARGADQLQLLSRSLIVNAKLQANWLDIATGANQINVATGTIIPQAGTGAAPTVAVDVGSLGGMYANSIYLVGTEAGVGVNSKGKLEALVGDIQLSSAGDLNIVDGQLKAAWDVRADAARDLTVQGSDVQAGGDVELVAARHLNVGATRNDSGSSTAAGSTTTTTATTHYTGSVIEAGGDVTLVANNQMSNGGNLTVSASAIRANGNALLTGSNVAVESKVDSKLVRSVTYIKKCKWYGSCKSSTTINQNLEETLAGGEVSAAGDVTVLALGDRDSTGSLIAETGNVLLLGAAVGSDLGTVQLTAANDLEVEAAQTRHETSNEIYRKKSGILSTTKTTNIDRSQNLIAEGSLVTGDSIQLQAGRDIMVRGGTLSADNDISLVAGRDMDILEARDFESRDSIRILKKSGLFGTGGLGITWGTKSTTQITEEDLDTASGSTLASITGGVSILGGRDVLIQGADILAGTDIDIVGNNVGILAAKNIYDRKDSYKTRTSGLTLALKGAVVSALEAAWQASQRAHGAEDDRLKAAYALKAGYNLYSAVIKDGGTALANLAQGDILTSGANSVGIELSLGTQSKTSVNTQHNVTYRASNLDATGDITVIARAPSEGQISGVIDIMGSTLKGYNQTLSAGKLLHVRHAPQTFASRETSKSESASIGVGLSVGDQNGFYISAGGQWGNSKGEAYKEDNGESRLIADNTLTLLSGGDATLKGTIATANRIEADIAGNLTLTSLQDIDRYTYKSQNAGFGVTLCIPPICYGTPVSGSINASGQKLDHDYQSVVEQTGLFAGAGGFNIKVGGHTQLNGAAIVSSATADKNKLVTQTLDYSDLANIEKTKVSGYSFGLGTSVASNYFVPTPGVNDNRTSVTQALISPANIIINGLATQQSVLQAQTFVLQSQINSLNAQLVGKSVIEAGLTETKAQLAKYRINTINGKVKFDVLLVYGPGLYKGQPRIQWNTCTGACATQYQQLRQTLVQHEATFASYVSLQTELADAQTRLLALQTKISLQAATSPTLQSRTLTTANPALANTFNANRTRAQLEAMAVFSETAFRIVGDVYKADVTVSDKKLREASTTLRTAQIANDPIAITAAQTALTAAQSERGVLDGKRAVAHGLVGGLTAALGGANPVSGLIGGVAGKLASTELSKLIDSSAWAIANPYAANLLKTLSATAAGSLVGGTTGGFVASQGDRFNRQLHPSIQAFLTKRSTVQGYLDSEKTKGRVISYELAQDELFTAGAVLNDKTIASILDSTTLASAKAWLQAHDVTSDSIGTYFNLDKNSQAYKDFSLYAVEALSGSGYANYKKYLSVNDALYIKAIERRLGEVQGVKQVAVNFFKNLAEYPDKIVAAKAQIEQLLDSDPQQVWAAIKSTASSLPDAAKAEFDKQMALYTLHTVFGENDKAAEIYTVAVLSVFDPGKKGTAVFDAVANTAKELDVIKKAAQIQSRTSAPKSVLGQKSDGRTARQVNAGQKGNWDRAVNGKLDPDTAYQLSNGHTYLTDGTGRVTAVEGTLTNNTFDRNGYQQCAAGKCGSSGDEGGHLIAASLGGAGDRINIVPQSAILNRGDYRAMEDELRAAVKAGQTVSVKIEVGYPVGGARPSEFKILATVDGINKPYRFSQ